MMPRPSPAIAIIALMFIVGGALHFLRPTPYLAIMPPYLPEPLLLVYLSGVAEIVGGIGVLVPRYRRVAGLWLILTLLAIVPANYEMVRQWQAKDGALLGLILLWLRLPVQALIIMWVWGATKPRTGDDGSANIGAVSA